MLYHNYKRSVVSFVSNLFQSRSLSNKSCILTRIHRSHYLRVYPTVIVRPDGSTYTVRFEEPRAIIKLPLDLSTLTEDERIKILENRKPKKKVIFQEEEKDDYDHEQYLKLLWRK